MRNEQRERFGVIRRVLLGGAALCTLLGVVNARLGVAESVEDKFHYVGDWYITVAFTIAAVTLLSLYFTKRERDDVEPESAATTMES